MKKYIILIFMIIPFLLPLNTYALNHYDYNTNTWKNTSFNSRDEYQGWYGERFQVTVDTYITQRLYFSSWSTPSNLKNVEYVDFSFIIHDYNGSMVDSVNIDGYGTHTLYENTGAGYTFVSILQQGYSESTKNGAGSSCYPMNVFYSSVNDVYGTMRCPVFDYDRAYFGQLITRWKFSDPIANGEHDIFFGISSQRTYVYSDSNDSIEGAIDSQTDDITNAQQDTTNAINDVNDTLNDDSTTNAESTGSSFFSNFTTRDFGLTSVVTAPITFIQSFTNTCSAAPVSFELFNHTITLPCGDVIFWNRQDVQGFRAIWNMIVGGPIIYALALKLFRTVQRALDPDKNDEGGLDL